MKLAVTGSSNSINSLCSLVPNLIKSKDATEADVVIKFSPENDLEGDYYTFNKNLGILDREDELNQLLKIDNISTVDNQPFRYQWKVKYHVEIFDLKVLRVLARRSRQKSLVTITNITSKLTRQVCEVAVSALYALGLDFGVVTIGVTEHDRKIIQSIRGGPDLSDRSLQLWSVWINKQKKLWEQEIKYVDHPTPSGWQSLMLGADPEFLLYDRYAGRWLIASDYFPRNGPVGTDARAIYNPRHGYPLAELRPAPARTPVQLTENIRRTIQIGLHYIPCRNVAWVAGSCPLKGLPNFITYKKY